MLRADAIGVAHLWPRGFGWTMSHMISSSRNPGWSAMMSLYMALRYEMLCIDKSHVSPCLPVTLYTSHSACFLSHESPGEHIERDFEGSSIRAFAFPADEVPLFR